ncbi:MAG: GNAT family N-acetyltransferase [Clostridiaceae bacterium]
MQCIIIKNDEALSFNEFYFLESECFPSEPYNEIQFNEIVQGDFWTARVNGNLAGFVNAITHESRIHLGRIEVDSQFRKAGIGGLLVDKVIDFAEMKKSPCVTLTVRTNNAPAYNLYIKKGFEVYGYKNRYAVPVQYLPEPSSVDFVQAGEGKNYPVSFVFNGHNVGTGRFNYQVGGCKDFILANPGSDILNVLSSIKAKLKPGSENLYIMTEDLKTIKALKALAFVVETEMADMIYKISCEKN